MKRLIIVLVILLYVVSAKAALVDNGDGTITDTDTNLMWLQDANYAATTGVYFNYQDEAWDWVEQLTYAGYDDWRLPSAYNQDGTGPCLGYNCIDSELGNLFYTALGNPSNSEPGAFTNSGPFINVQTSIGYWSNDYEWDDTCLGVTPCVWIFTYDYGQLPIDYNLDGESAWAVRVVPEPISSTLFIVGGATLGFRRFRKKFKK